MDMSLSRTLEAAVAQDQAITKAGKEMQVRELNAYYGGFLAVSGVNLTIHANHVTAFIGPSGCGKSTFIRCLNRLHEVTRDARVEGQVLLDGENLYESSIDPVTVRRSIGMVFQRPNPFPTMSIFDNVASGLRLNGLRDKGTLAETVERCLRQSAPLG